MVWKSRADKLPPPSYFSMIVGYLQAPYRGARISQEMMRALLPFWIEAWRSGKTAESAAQRMGPQFSQRRLIFCAAAPSMPGSNGSLASRE